MTAPTMYRSRDLMTHEYVNECLRNLKIEGVYENSCNMKDFSCNCFLQLESEKKTIFNILKSSFFNLELIGLAVNYWTRRRKLKNLSIFLKFCNLPFRILFNPPLETPINFESPNCNNISKLIASPLLLLFLHRNKSIRPTETAVFPPFPRTMQVLNCNLVAPRGLNENIFISTKR